MNRKPIGLSVPYRKVSEPEPGCKECKEWERVCDQHLRHIAKLKRRRLFRVLTEDEKLELRNSQMPLAALIEVVQLRLIERNK